MTSVFFYHNAMGSNSQPFLKKDFFDTIYKFKKVATGDGKRLTKISKGDKIIKVNWGHSSVG